MTELELARVSETADLSGGVVVYDKSRVIVVAKKMVTCEQCGEVDSFLFILHKRTKARIGIIMDLDDDVHIYIKPAYRGKGYASLVMREVVPYWMPQLVSITSVFEYQDKKIAYLAKCGQMSLRSRNRDPYDDIEMRAKMNARKLDMLETSIYANALQNAPDDYYALYGCRDKVQKPHILTKDYPSKDADFLGALDGNNPINCDKGTIQLPLTQFMPIDWQNDSVEQLYQHLRRLCHIEIFQEDDDIYIEFTPHNSTMMYWNEKRRYDEMLQLNFIRIDTNDIYLSLITPFHNANKWFNRYVKAPNNLAEDAYEYHYPWGMIELEGDYIEITFHRTEMETEIKKAISKHALEIILP